MWIDLALQRVQACLEQQLLLLLEFELDAIHVPDFQRNRDARNHRGINRELQRETGAINVEKLVREYARQFHPGELKYHDNHEEADLPVQSKRISQNAFQPPVDAEIHKGRERPDVFRIMSSIP